jgi:hypothetical protein
MKISSEIEVCNLALLKIGQNTISSFDDEIPQAQLCRYSYDQSKQSLLYQYPWSFATKEDGLTQIVERGNGEAVPRYKYVYSIPEAFLRLVSIYDGANREMTAFTGCKPAYEVQNARLMTDFNPCRIKYVFDLGIVTQMSPLFIDAMVCDLAIRMTKVFNDSSTYLQQLEQDFMITFEKAKIEDARQKQLPQVTSYPLFLESGIF